MYVRVKRRRQTIFLSVEPSETVLECKEKIQSLLDTPADMQRLYADGILLEDMRTLAELKIENDSVLALTYRTPDGGWEDILIEQPGGSVDHAAAPPPAEAKAEADAAPGGEEAAPQEQDRVLPFS